jgi:methionine synthase II (cobalamin-independent)
MQKEIELVKAARVRGDSAKTPEERGAASEAAFETTTAPAAAQAIGVAVDRYQATRRTVNRVFETLDFQGKIPGPMEIDTARASPEMKKRLTGDPLDELAPASAAALRARLDALSRVWIEYVKLVAMAG